MRARRRGGGVPPLFGGPGPDGRGRASRLCRPAGRLPHRAPTCGRRIVRGQAGHQLLPQPRARPVLQQRLHGRDQRRPARSWPCCTTRGQLTDRRTAIAGAIAAPRHRPASAPHARRGRAGSRRGCRPADRTTAGPPTILVWARNADRAAALAADVGGEAVGLPELARPRGYDRDDHPVDGAAADRRPDPAGPPDRRGRRRRAGQGRSWRRRSWPVPGSSSISRAMPGPRRGRMGGAGRAGRPGIADPNWGLCSRPRSPSAAEEIVVADLTGVAVQDAADRQEVVWRGLQRARRQECQPTRLR